MRPIGQVMNILRIFHLATASEVEAGLTWYRDMYTHVARLVRLSNPRRLPSDRRTIAGVIASLSPNKNWANNISLVVDLYESGKLSHIKTQNAKALRILAGEDPFDVLTGPKERAFFLCFADPRRTDAVTVDGHAYSIWMGELIYTSRARITKRLFELAAEDYRRAAALVGLRPNQIQAITWVAWRRINRSTGHTMDKNKGL